MFYVSYTPERWRSYRYCIEFGLPGLIRYNICKTVIFTAYNQYINASLISDNGIPGEVIYSIPHNYWDSPFLISFWKWWERNLFKLLACFPIPNYLCIVISQCLWFYMNNMFKLISDKFDITLSTSCRVMKRWLGARVDNRGKGLVGQQNTARLADGDWDHWFTKENWKVLRT